MSRSSVGDSLSFTLSFSPLRNEVPQLTGPRSQNHVVMKVSTSLQKFPTATDREYKIYERLAKVNSTHPGQSLIRELYDSFELKGRAGKHRCLVLQPMHMTLLEMMRLNPRPFGLPLLKLTLQRLLLALDFLHTEAGIIHTGAGTLFAAVRTRISR